MEIENSEVLVGQTLRGYDVETLIAQGGFGQVYRAAQPSLDRTVAIKVILPQYANQESFVRRFEYEAQLIARLEHPFIVPLYDYWRDPSGAYLVMRYMRGGSLLDLVEKRPLSLATASRMLDQLAAALTTAHRGGIIHRDMKPANVLLDDEDEPNAYLADFGIAKRLHEYADDDEDRFGSPAYVAPEQVSGSMLSAQTDIYSLGIILYEMLTGALPFIAPSQTLMLEQQLTAEVPSLRNVRPDLPEEVNFVIRRATQKQPRDRYPDAMSLADDFRRLIQIHGGSDSPSQAQSIQSGGKAKNTLEMNTVVLNIAAVGQKNPYKGLFAFQEPDAIDFFGRESVVTRLVGRLRKEGIQSKFLALIGPSGSGKSSVVRAGLLPALRRGVVPNSNKWLFATIVPGAQPFVQLQDALLKIAVSEPRHSLDNLRSQPETLAMILEDILPQGNAEFVLVIDQFEELFSNEVDEAQRAAFLKLLTVNIRNPKARLRIIVTLRADFYDRPLVYPAFGEIIGECTEVVPVMSAADMENAITRPAARLQVAFEQGLPAQIIQDVSTQLGALPLLQFALTELFEKRNGKTITMRMFDEMGGVFGSLARRAEEIYAELSAKEKDIARWMFVHLVNTGENSEDTRRRVRVLQLMYAISDRATFEKVSETFAKARLLTFDRDPTTRVPTIEIAHEALIRSWERLRSWLDEDRDKLRLHQRLGAAAAEWVQGGRASGYLAREARLAQFEPLLTAKDVQLSDEERAYLVSSMGQRQRDKQRDQRIRIALASIAGIALLAAIIAFILRADAATARDQFDSEARISRSRELAVQSIQNERRVDLSLLLSLESLRSANTFEARSSLLSALQYSPHLESFLYGSTDWVRAVAISPDGGSVLAASRDNQLYWWNTANPQEQQGLQGHTDWVNTVAFSPDGQYFASAGNDDTIILWDMISKSRIGEPLSGHTDNIWSIAFTPDSTQIASVGEDGSLRLWDVNTRQPIGDPYFVDVDNPIALYAVAISPNGEQIVVGAADNNAYIWDITTDEASAQPMIGHGNWVMALAFNPDGRLLASGALDGEVRLWDVQSLESLANLRGHTQGIRAIAFSPTGDLIASGSADNTVRLWDAQSGAPAATPFLGHTDEVWGVAFSPNGETLVSGSQDALVGRWNITPRLIGAAYTATSPLSTVGYHSASQTLIAAQINDGVNGASLLVWREGAQTPETLAAEADIITSLATFPNQAAFVMVDTNGALTKWDIMTGASSVLTQLDFLPYIVAISADGAKIVVGGDQSDVGQAIRLFDADGAELPLSITLDAEAIYSMAFSSDSARLVIGDSNGNISVWDASTGAAIVTPLFAHDEGVSTLAFSADGMFLASGGRDNRIQLWDANTWQASRPPLTGHTDRLSAVAFNTDGTVLASASEDSTVRLWDLNTGQELSFLGHTDWATGVVFVPDTQRIVSSGRDGNLIFWDLDTDTWQTQACSIANRQLTPSEWARYFGGEPERATCSP
jgi:WD40 repeat protein/serine/threonine protein kinase